MTVGSAGFQGLITPRRHGAKASIGHRRHYAVQRRGQLHQLKILFNPHRSVGGRDQVQFKVGMGRFLPDLKVHKAVEFTV